METSFLKLIEHSIKEHWHLPSLTDYEGAEHNYKDVARWIEKFHKLGNCIPRHANLRGCGRTHP